MFFFRNFCILIPTHVSILSCTFCYPLIRSFVSSTSPTKVKYITSALSDRIATVRYDVFCLDRCITMQTSLPFQLLFYSLTFSPLVFTRPSSRPLTKIKKCVGINRQIFKLGIRAQFPISRTPSCHP
jgi:hypothetical protein